MDAWHILDLGSNNYQLMTAIRSITVLLLTFLSLSSLHSQTLQIQNDVFWYAKDSTPINSQGGGIFRFRDPVSGVEKYYWYGVHYREADLYRKDPSVTLPNATFEAVTCYSSTDLSQWTFEGNVLTREELKKHSPRPTWVGRLGVAYVKEMGQYALVVQHGDKVLFALSPTPTGQFSWHNQVSMMEMIGTPNTGDQTVFTDETTGRSYLVYSYGQGRNKIYVSEIGVKEGKVGLLDCTKIFQGASREGNCMFQYGGKYYMFASNIYGWDASLAYYLVADNIRGPYLPTNDMLVMKGSTEDYAHVTQTGFFFTVKGSKKETVIYCGDRWANFAGNGLGYNQWFPVSFKGDTPYFNSLSSWSLNSRTGEWKVGARNNYVKNGSFEADRKSVPTPVKPVQTELTGWNTTVLQGNAISLDSLRSPYLNHHNSEAERKVVIGEKSLAITDRVPFQRKVQQVIASTPFVPLPKGSYTLRARIRNSSGFSKLEMYAVSGGKTFTYSIEGENADWITVAIPKVKVKNSRVEIGFLAHGKADASCFVDDVELTRE